MTPLILIQPINYAVLQGIKKIAACLHLSQEFDQVSSESVFFVCPKNPLTNFLWQFLKDFSTFVTNFMICGTNSDAIANTMYESLNKYFWRDLLDNSGANIASELGRFENRQLGKFNDIFIWRRLRFVTTLLYYYKTVPYFLNFLFLLHTNTSTINT